MIHPTEPSLAGLYPMNTQTKVPVVCDGKTKLYLTRALLMKVQNSSHCKEVQNKKTPGFWKGYVVKHNNVN